MNLGNGKEEVVYSRSDMVSYIHLDRGVRMDRKVGGAVLGEGGGQVLCVDRNMGDGLVFKVVNKKGLFKLYLYNSFLFLFPC